MLLSCSPRSAIGPDDRPSSRVAPSHTILSTMWKKILGFTVLVAVAGIAAVFGYLYTRKPATAPPLAIKIEMTPERIERGRYIFQFVSDCDGCHSERDMGRFGGPVVAKTRGKGIEFPREMGLPGVV